MLSTANSYKDILGKQEYDRNVFEDEKYVNWPQEDEDPINCLRQIDTDNVDPIMCNSN